MGKSVDINLSYSSKKDIPDSFYKTTGINKTDVIETNGRVYARNVYVSNTQKQALETQSKLEAAGVKIDLIKAREQARKENTGYSKRIIAESKAKILAVQEAQKTQPIYKRQVGTITESAPLAQPKPILFSKQPLIQIKERIPLLKSNTVSAAETSSNRLKQFSQISKPKSTVTDKGSSASILTLEQNRDYGIITEKEYKDTKSFEKGLTTAAKISSIFGKAKELKGEFGDLKTDTSYKAAEAAAEISRFRQQAFERTEKVIDWYPKAPTAKEKAMGGVFGEIKEFGRATGKEVLTGVMTTLPDLPFAVSEAGLKQASIESTKKKYPELVPAIKQEQASAFSTAMKETTKPEVLASAAIFAFAPSIKGVKPKTKTTTTKTETIGKPSKTGEQFYRDYEVGKTKTGERSFSAIEETTGKRVEISKTQAIKISIGKKAQARSPFDIFSKAKDRNLKIKKEKATKDLIKFEEIKALDKPARPLYKPTKTNKKSLTKTTPKDIIKSPAKDIITTKPKDIIITKPKDIIKSPAKDIITTKPKDIIKRTKNEIIRRPEEIFRAKEYPIKEPIKKPKSKKPIPFGFPDFDFDLGGSGGGFGRFKGASGVRKRKTGYAPSLIASTFNIRGKAPTGELTGFEFRPISDSTTKKKKKKKQRGIFSNL